MCNKHQQDLKLLLPAVYNKNQNSTKTSKKFYYHIQSRAQKQKLPRKFGTSQK